MSSRGLQFKTINNGGTYKSILHINSADRMSFKNLIILELI